MVSEFHLISELKGQNSFPSIIRRLADYPYIEAEIAQTPRRVRKFSRDRARWPRGTCSPSVTPASSRSLSNSGHAADDDRRSATSTARQRARSASPKGRPPAVRPRSGPVLLPRSCLRSGGASEDSSRPPPARPGIPHEVDPQYGSAPDWNRLAWSLTRRGRLIILARHFTEGELVSLVVIPVRGQRQPYPHSTNVITCSRMVLLTSRLRSGRVAI